MNLWGLGFGIWDFMLKSLTSVLIFVALVLGSLLLIVRKGPVGAVALLGAAAVVVLLVSFLEGLAGLWARLREPKDRR